MPFTSAQGGQYEIQVGQYLENRYKGGTLRHINGSDVNARHLCQIYPGREGIGYIKRLYTQTANNSERSTTDILHASLSPLYGVDHITVNELDKVEIIHEDKLRSNKLVESDVGTTSCVAHMHQNASTGVKFELITNMESKISPQLDTFFHTITRVGFDPVANLDVHAIGSSGMPSSTTSHIPKSLHDYQTNMRDSLVDIITTSPAATRPQERCKVVGMECVTGGGKTVLFISTIKKLRESNTYNLFIVACPKIELCEQFEKEACNENLGMVTTTRAMPGQMVLYMSLLIHGLKKRSIPDKGVS